MAIYRVISAHFQGVCGMVRILPHPQVDLGAIYSSSQPKKQKCFILFSNRFVFRGVSTQEPASVTSDDLWSFFFSFNVGFAFDLRL